jgi:hypothetical protein
MAFTDDLVLDDVSGDDVTYRLTARDGSGSKRIDIATTLAEPAFLSIRHSQAGKGADIVDRHLVQFTRTKNDTNGVPRTMTVNLTVAVPRNTAFTSTIINDQIMNLLDLMASGGLASLASTANIDSLLRGES